MHSQIMICTRSKPRSLTLRREGNISQAAFGTP